MNEKLMRAIIVITEMILLIPLFIALAVYVLIYALIEAIRYRWDTDDWIGYFRDIRCIVRGFCCSMKVYIHTGEWIFH